MVILVCAANGRIGSRTIGGLIKSGRADELVAGLRDTKAGGDLKERVADIRRVDYEDTNSLDSAFQGIERVVLIPSFADTETRARQGANVVEAAERQGVRQVIFVGFMDTRSDSPLHLTEAYRRIESALSESSLAWTVLRTSMYTDNLEEQFPVWLKRSELMTCAGEGKIAYVSRDDITASIIGVLLAAVEEHANKVYKLTGPHALSYDNVRGIVNDFFDTKIEIKHVNVEEFKEGLRQIWGVAYPKYEHVARITPLFQMVFKQNFMNIVTDHVEQLSGHPPEDVETWLEQNVDRSQYTPLLEQSQ
jgi:NAD(P)H dehydrogenase (quinone)